MAKNETYEEFVEKFKPKKTTDDCYTPENIYEAIAEFVSSEYGVERSDMVRPFWPGGDYQAHDYPDGCCVVDNPPFSILAKIVTFYVENDIKFFLFAPALTCFNSSSKTNTSRVCVGANITYENGANVSTSFLTNLEDTAVRSCPELYKAIEAENKKNLAVIKKQVPKYAYPDEVLTAAMVGKYSKYGVEFSVGWDDVSSRINALDAQKPMKKGLYGAGYLLSERAAAERAAAERAAAERAAAERAAAERAAATKWKLSDREKDIVKKLGKQGGEIGAPTS